MLPRCLDAIEREQLATALVVVDNASQEPLELPETAQRVTLATRLTVGAARNAGLKHVDTPYVVFADADDEVAPGSLPRSLALLERNPRAAGVIGRSLVDEGGVDVHRGIRPTTRYRYASRFAPGLVPLLWLAGYQGSITSTVLRTQAVRDAGGFADANTAEDWHLAARLARRGGFVCIDDPVRIYHRHGRALRAREPRASAAEQRQAICDGCRADPASTRLHRGIAGVLLRRAIREVAGGG
jgi:glycosyltransferase involved in cell wall biosynthesis